MQRDLVKLSPDFRELDDAYWHGLGFGGGLEIHQQLATRKKLFCRCPVGLVHVAPDARIVRHMRPTLSEMGEYDGTALMEFKTRKNVTYELFSESTCSYEMDDTPPFPVNQEALDIAIEISLLFNCSIVDEVHVTRKQYLDGSIPTGFQRTLIVGVGGWIPFKGRRLNITQVNLEEDACREMSDVGHDIIFRTDRLSTPLVEIITEKELLTPREMGEANRELGRVLRSSGRVRRGIGSVRQDVNVSVRGGDRNEIKGVQRYQRVLALTHYEGLRQKALLEIRDLLARQGISDKTFKAEEKILPWEGKIAGVVKLCGFAGILNRELVPSRTFSDEIADRVRVIACLDESPNLHHSDNRTSEGIPAKDWDTLLGVMKARPEDVLVVTFGPEADVKTAMSEIRIRACEAAAGVPRETRQDLGGGITGFERILPGPDRMYPDTDSEPVRITDERVARIRGALPLRPWEREERCRKLGISGGMVEQLADAEDWDRFERLGKKHKDLALELAQMFCRHLPWLRRNGHDPARLPDEPLVALAKAAAEKTVGQKNMQDLLLELARRPDAGAALLKTRLEPEDTGKTRKLVRHTVEKTLADFRGDRMHLFDAAMGRLLRENQGLAVSRRLLDLVRDEVKTAQA